MWNTVSGIRILQGHEAAVFRSTVGFMLDEIRERLSGWGQEEAVATGVAVFDRLTLAQQVAVLAEVVPALLDDRIAAPLIAAVHDATIYALFQYYGVVFEELTPKHNLRDRKQLLAAARQLGYEDLPRPTDTDSQAWDDLLERLADAILHDRDFEMEPVTADSPPEQAESVHAFLGIARSYHAYVPPDPPDPKPLLARIEAYVKHT